jgi:hypothetical protein
MNKHFFDGGHHLELFVEWNLPSGTVSHGGPLLELGYPRRKCRRFVAEKITGTKTWYVSWSEAFMQAIISHQVFFTILFWS